MQQQGGNPMMQALKNLRRNPLQFISQKGFNIPQNIGNDPNKIIQHLMNTGQIPQERYNQVMQSIQNFRK